MLYSAWSERMFINPYLESEDTPKRRRRRKFEFPKPPFNKSKDLEPTRNPDMRKKRKKVNQEDKAKNKLPKKQVPKKKEVTNEKPMSIRAAKRIWNAPRPKGRPPKSFSQKLRTAKKVLKAAGIPTKKTPVKKDSARKRGRPRKEPLVNQPKRKRGRPRKPPIAGDKPKRNRGRPKKMVTASEAAKPKRKRGRPKKNPAEVNTERLKKKRGRPRKNPLQQLSDEAKKKKRNQKDTP